MKLTAKNNKETEKIGQELAGHLKGGDILCLEGNLGAGKTTLVKGLARAFGIKNDITSPTFALMNIYDIKSLKHLPDMPDGKSWQAGKNIHPVKSRKAGISAKPKLFNRVKTLVHIDTYRLKNEQELIDIGAEDYLGKPDTICVIEWPEKIKKLLKNKKTVKVTIEHIKDGRRITVSGKL